MRIILVALAAVFLVVGMGYFSFNLTISKEIKELFKGHQEIAKQVLQEEDIRHLPEPVQRYVRYTRCIGREKIRAVRLRQKGQIRGEGKNWMDIKAEQYYTADQPGFIWSANMNIVKVRDKYFAGKGNMLVKLLSVFVITDAQGPDMDNASLMRYFNEMMWFPPGYVSDKITWETVDKNTVKATYTDAGMTCPAILSFNDQGQLTNFVADRYNADHKRLFKWSTPISEYREINGYLLPAKGEAIWHLDTGDFSYIKLEITDIEYNRPEAY